jgi:hypothetical protein
MMTEQRRKEISDTVNMLRRTLPKLRTYGGVQETKQQIDRLSVLLGDRADERHCWLGFGDRRECPNMCAGRLCGYAKS